MLLPGIPGTTQVWPNRAAGAEARRAQASGPPTVVGRPRWPRRPGIFPNKPGSWVVTPPRIRPYAPWSRYGPGYFPYPYQKVPVELMGLLQPQPQTSTAPRPPAPQKLYGPKPSKEQLARYCSTLYRPFCRTSQDPQYCAHYRDMCSEPLLPVPPVAVAGRKFFQQMVVAGMVVGQPTVRPAPSPGPSPGYSSNMSPLYGRPQVEIPPWALGGRPKRSSRGGWATWWPAYPWGGGLWGWGPWYGIEPMTVPVGPRAVEERPPAPQKIYAQPMSEADAKRYCKTFYRPYCADTSDPRYCEHYREFCTTHAA